MARASQHRQAVIETASRLFRSQGFSATGLNQIVQESGAPKGSIYHYFPEGKEAIAAATVAFAGEKVENTLRLLMQDAPEPGALIRRYARLLAGWMAASGFKDGCPIATTLLENAPESAAVRAAGEAAFASWAGVFCEVLQNHHVDKARALRLARLAVAAMEGALLQARVATHEQALIDAAEEIAMAFEIAISNAADATSKD